MKTTDKVLLIGVVGLGAGWLLNERVIKKGFDRQLGRLPTAAGLGAAPLKLTQSSDEVTAAVQRITRQAGKWIERASILTGTPAWLITGIAAYEIGTKMPFNWVHPGSIMATGIMQMTPDTLYDSYLHANKLGFINPAITSFYQMKLGNDYVPFLKTALSGRSNRAAGVRYLKDPEFAVVAGALMLRVLTYYFDEGGTPNLARLVVGYNQGLSFVKNKLLRLVGITAVALRSQFPGQAGTYVANMLAPNGYLDQARTEWSRAPAG